MKLVLWSVVVGVLVNLHFGGTSLGIAVALILILVCEAIQNRGKS